MRISPRRPEARSGKTLLLFVLLSPVLVGTIGLVIDGGLLLVAYRQTQNAADAAALGAAIDKFRGSSDTTALATAQDFVTKNGVSGVTLTLNGGATNALNIPPQDPDSTGSPFTGDSRYVEVLVSRPVNTLLIHVLGVNSSRQVKARAVAGFEAVGAGQGVMVLDPTAAPGLDVSANLSNNSFVRLKVNGNITVNSEGGGVDQFGATVASSYNQDAVKTQTGTLSVPPIVATDLQIVGGITNPNNVSLYEPSITPDNYNPSNTDHPIFARAGRAPDPLENIATPTSSTGVAVSYDSNGRYRFPLLNNDDTWGWSDEPQNISVTNGHTVTFSPGIYRSISINGGTVTFQAGIYVIGVVEGNGNVSTALSITGGATTATGVLFYNTGAKLNKTNQTWDANGWNPTNGGADRLDVGRTPQNVSQISLGGINISGGGQGFSLSFTPFNNTGNANDPFNGLSFYQRRWNTSTLSISGSASDTTLDGTWYAKWARFNLAGSGNYNAQFLVGSMTITGQATVTINATGKEKGKANLVFLVE